MRMSAVIDGIGVYGNFFHYGIVIALVGSAFMIFVYLWFKKRLDMDEAPKFQMLQDFQDEPVNKQDQDQQN